MIIKKNTKIKINHQRKGIFDGIATETFDTETTEFFPVSTLKHIHGMSNDYEVGEPVPCRKSLCTIEIIKKGENKLCTT